jgi:SPP1 family predicted phage head-tail adaptor
VTIPIGYHELNRGLTVWRPTPVDDGQGGETTELVQRDKVRAKVSQPTAIEQSEAQQAGSSLSMTVHLRPDADVRRGDELRDADLRLRVKWTIFPSDPVYLRADCERIQAEGQR